MGRKGKSHEHGGPCGNCGAPGHHGRDCPAGSGGAAEHGSGSKKKGKKGARGGEEAVEEEGWSVPNGREAPELKPPCHDADAWLAKFKANSEFRDLRKCVQWDTLLALDMDGYVDCDGAPVTLDTACMHAGVTSCMQYSDKDNERHGKPGACIATDFRVLDQDCLEVAKTIQELDGSSHVAVLNMANETRPGGGWLNGAGAQEENLHRRSNLCDHLSNYRNRGPPSVPSYPLDEFGCVFNPDVCVFRGAESQGYPFLPKPYFVSMLTSAAYFRPDIDQDWRLTAKYAKGMRSKICSMLRVARRHKVCSLVPSAFGCGAFRNPPAHVAEIFQDVLNTSEFKDQFRRVWFAIIDDHNANSWEGNVLPFAKVFEPAGAAAAAGKAGKAAKKGGGPDHKKTPCKFGTGCRDKSKHHREGFSHPGASSSSGVFKIAAAKNLFKYVAGVLNKAFLAKELSDPESTTKVILDARVSLPFWSSEAENLTFFAVCDALADAIDAGAVPQDGIDVLAGLSVGLSANGVESCMKLPQALERRKR